MMAARAARVDSVLQGVVTRRSVVVRARVDRCRPRFSPDRVPDRAPGAGRIRPRAGSLRCGSADTGADSWADTGAG